jgi:hypothetical protein
LEKIKLYKFKKVQDTRGMLQLLEMTCKLNEKQTKLVHKNNIQININRSVNWYKNYQTKVGSLLEGYDYTFFIIDGVNIGAAWGVVILRISFFFFLLATDGYNMELLWKFNKLLDHFTTS